MPPDTRFQTSGKRPFAQSEPPSYYAFLGLALNELLIEKGLLTPSEVRAQIEATEQLNAGIHGVRVVAKAWADADFHDALLRDASAAVHSMGIHLGDVELVALENTSRLHNLVVCSLGSNYPRGLLGRPPSWYESPAYRARAVREPRKVLAEFGLQIPEDLEVRVHDSTAELRYLVIPRRPAETEGWSERDLALLVTRNSMLGAGTPLSPSHP